VPVSCALRLMTYTAKNIRISMDILRRVFHISTQPVPYTFVSITRRNNEARAHVAPDSRITRHEISVDIWIFLQCRRIKTRPPVSNTRHLLMSLEHQMFSHNLPLARSVVLRHRFHSVALTTTVPVITHRYRSDALSPCLTPPTVRRLGIQTPVDRR